MEIKPTYVTFEQAKWLKEKGFDINTRTAYDYRTYQPSNLFEENLEIINNAKNYSNSEYERFQRPEQWQIVEWFRINHDIWVIVNIAIDNTWYFELYDLKDKRNAEIFIEAKHNTYFHNSPQNAYSAAIDYVLKKLI
jgi:hypothetical protein